MLGSHFGGNFILKAGILLKVEVEQQQKNKNDIKKRTIG